MTREEEAIKELNTLKISTKSESGKNALDFAIQLLKQKMPDCEHCIHTYGTFGCCDMINYEWVYDCEFGKEQYKKEHKPQPSEDCISRQAILGIIHFEDNWLYDTQSHNANTVIAFSGLKSKVKALPSVNPQEQEPVIDNIRAEIEQEYKVESEHPYGQGLRRVLEIIDKYKTESEDKE